MEFITSPIDWWIEPFADNIFMRNALWSGLLAVLTTSTVGTWVVLRGMSFFGEALAHGVLPGLAIAFIIGGDTTVGALIAALVMVTGINLIRNHSPLPDDSSIGLLYVGFLALAVVILSSSSGAYSGDLTRFLFGSITGVTNSDL
ncbi:MAG: metal ABC transporter permease, partial [bacterium]|nr:metal ABC transporter permease [bacterium]